jgi:hypothetical protein
MDRIKRLRERAEYWRAMAARITDARAINVLHNLAEEVEAEIARLRAGGTGRQQPQRR